MSRSKQPLNNGKSIMPLHALTELSWQRSDPECRCGLRGARYTGVLSFPSAILALLLTAAFFGGLAWLPSRFNHYAVVFTERGPIQYVTMFAALWCGVILTIKSLKLRLQHRALEKPVVPQEIGFILSTSTVDDVMDRVFAAVDDPKRFVLFNRIAVALSNLRNLGRVTDVDEILRSQAEHDESIMESSYSLVKGLIWAIPVLGFIGTVLGLSEAISGFGNVLSSAAEMSEITAALKGVTAGLATAFDTTLVALVAALLLQIAATFIHKNEEEFLDGCAEYCQRHIVNRLRIMPFHADET